MTTYVFYNNTNCGHQYGLRTSVTLESTINGVH